jgi:hypothetical protein
VLTYSLHLIGISAHIAFMLLVAVGAEVARNLRLDRTPTPATFVALRASLADFTKGYVVAKLFVFALMANVLTWKWKHPQNSLNLKLMCLTLTISGVFLASIPRYYIELEWFLLRVRRADAQGVARPVESEDLRSANVRLIAWAVDGLLISSFIWITVSALSGS